jgi:FkbM family methyltransferase
VLAFSIPGAPILSTLRRAFGRLPAPLRAGARRIGRTILTEVFSVSDPFVDLSRVVRKANPAAILDIGAHVGETSLELARRFPGIPIHAFEPTPASYERLRENTRHLNFVVTHNIALGRETCTQRLFVNNNAQTNSLLDNASGNMTYLANDTAHRGWVDVQVTTLDRWTKDHLGLNPIVIKADVQGTELQLLEGGRETFRDCAVAFYTEASIAELYLDQADLLSIMSYMHSMETFDLYQLYRTRSNSHGRALWLDAMWVRSDLVAAMEAGEPD